MWPDTLLQYQSRNRLRSDASSSGAKLFARLLSAQSRQNFGMVSQRHNGNSCTASDNLRQTIPNFFLACRFERHFLGIKMSALL